MNEMFFFLFFFFYKFPFLRVEWILIRIIEKKKKKNGRFLNDN